jgi:hypothetical protein
MAGFVLAGQQFSASRRSAPKLALSTIEFQHILLLTSTGLLMEGIDPPKARRINSGR